MSDGEDDHGLSSSNTYSRGMGGCLTRLFESCSDDPKGSVHRAWGLTLIFVVIYSIMAFSAMVKLQVYRSSKALQIAALWTGIMHLLLGILGTFVLKRFPTSFSVGFFLGVLLILCNQNIILFGAFNAAPFGDTGNNRSFASLALSLAFLLCIFCMMLFHFRRFIIVAPVDTPSAAAQRQRAQMASTSTKMQSPQITSPLAGGGTTGPRGEKLLHDDDVPLPDISDNEDNNNNNNHNHRYNNREDDAMRYGAQ